MLVLIHAACPTGVGVSGEGFLLGTFVYLWKKLMEGVSKAKRTLQDECAVFVIWGWGFDLTRWGRDDIIV